MLSRDPSKMPYRKKEFLAEFLVVISFLNEWRYCVSLLPSEYVFLTPRNRSKIFWPTYNLLITRVSILPSSVRSKYHLGEPVTKWKKKSCSNLLCLRWRDLQTLAEIATQAEKLKISQLELVEKIHDDKISDIKPPIKRKLSSFVKAIRKLRSLDKDVILLFISPITLLKRDILGHPALRVDSETSLFDRLWISSEEDPTRLGN